jgi:beta-lactamase class A
MKAAVVACGFLLSSTALGQSKAQKEPDLLWNKLDKRVGDMVERFDGLMGVAILDLTDGRTILHNADHVFPTASSIKIAILVELYRQEQQARRGAQANARLNMFTPLTPKTWSKTARSWPGSLRV